MGWAIHHSNSGVKNRLIASEKTPIADALLLKPKLLADDRGVFSRLFCRKTLAAAGHQFDIEQINNSSTKHAGTIRGLHYQVGDYPEAKLVRCIAGSIFDVIAYTRRNSPTYGKWFGVVLSPKEREMLIVPEGVAHGFQSLEEHSEVVYASTAEYSPDDERGLRWNDPLFNIEWPIKEDIDLSEKDQQWPDF